jgi:hypothetical protein
MFRMAPQVYWQFPNTAGGLGWQPRITTPECRHWTGVLREYAEIQYK